MKSSRKKKFTFPAQLASLLIAVIAATGMWYVVSVRDRIEAQFDVSLDYYGIPKDMVVTDGLIKKLTVRLRGPGTLLRSMSQQNLNQQINLSDIKTGVTVVPLAADNLKGSFRAFEIMDIQPPRIVVKADHILERSVPVRPTINSVLRNGALTVEDLTVTPDMVTLRGPESIVSGISSVRLPIQPDSRAAGQTFTQTMPLDTPNLVTSTPASVRVQYTITSGRAILDRTIHLAISSHTPSDYVVEPSQVALQIEVPEALAKSSSYVSRLVVSVTPPPDMKPGETRDVAIQFRTPEGMTVIASSVSEVSLTRKDTSSSTEADK